MGGCERHSKTQGTGSWEEVIAPFSCSFYAINAASQGVTFDKCSDPNDGSTSVLGISQFVVMAPPPYWQSHRWEAGDIVTWIRSSVPLNLYFLK